MTDDELTDWGIAFVAELDEKYKDDPRYTDSDQVYVLEKIAEDYPELTTDQMDWLEDFFDDAV